MKRIVMVVAALLVVGLLGGCMTPEAGRASTEVSTRNGFISVDRVEHLMVTINVPPGMPEWTRDGETPRGLAGLLNQYVEVMVEPTSTSEQTSNQDIKPVTDIPVSLTGN